MRYNKPFIALPTLMVFMTSFILTSISINLPLINVYIEEYIIYSNILINIMSLIISVFAAYIQFTIVHDSIHYAISKNKYINNVIGMIASIWLGPTINWVAFKQHHLLHHRETNDPQTDPDYYCSDKGPGGPNYIIIRWMTLDLYYWYLNDTKNIISTIIYEIILISGIYYVYINVGFSFMLQYWIIPSRITILILSYAFSYLPHYPHITKKSDNKFKTTSYIYAPWYIKFFMSPLAFYQDYHLIHHYIPFIPFYKYHEAWLLNKDKLEKEGINTINILDHIPLYSNAINILEKPTKKVTEIIDNIFN